VNIDEWKRLWGQDNRLTLQQRGVLSLVSGHLEGGRCTLGAAGVAYMSGVSERTAQRRIRELLEAGWVCGKHGDLRPSFPGHDTCDDSGDVTADATGDGVTHDDTRDVTADASQSPSSPSSPLKEKNPQTPIKENNPSSNPPPPPDDDHGAGEREAQDLTSEFAADPDVEAKVDEQWLQTELADHGLQPTIQDPQQILRRLKASRLEPGKWKPYLLDRLATYQAKISEGETTPQKAKSWIGRSDNVRWWIEDGPDDGSQGRLPGQLDPELGDDDRLDEILTQEV